MPKPKETDLPLPVFMLHQLAHVELNAINLAWDTVARFSHLQLPQVRFQGSECRVWYFYSYLSTNIAFIAVQ